MKRFGDMVREELRYAAKCDVLDRYFFCAFFLCLGLSFVFVVGGQIGTLFGTFCMVTGYVIMLGANMRMTDCKLTEAIDEMNDKERRLRELQEQVEALRNAR